MTRKHLITILFFTSSIVTAVSWWNRNTLTDGTPWLPALNEAPSQRKVTEPGFVEHANGFDYHIQPLYDYDLTGLVVSFNRFSPGIGLHERWKDYINVADVCVVWGVNAKDVDLSAFEFWNLEFTCNFQTHDRDEWQRFDQDALSNNHLLSTDPAIHDVLDDLRVGDIVRLRGQLVEYGQPGAPVRGTSTTRTDRGNGACETIHVEHAAILASMDSGWRTALWLGLLGLFLSLIFWFTAPHAALR